MAKIFLALLCSTILAAQSVVAQSVVVIQNNQQVRSGSINDSIRGREQEYWVERVGFRIAKDNDYALYAVLRGLGAAAQNNDGQSLDSKTLTQIGLDSLSYFNDPGASPKFQGQDTATTALTSGASIANPWVGVAAGPVLDMMSANLSDQMSALYPIDSSNLRSRFLEEGSDGLRNLAAQAYKDPRLKVAINAVIEKRYKGISLDDDEVTSPDQDLETRKIAVQSLANRAVSPQELEAALEKFANGQDQKLANLDKDLQSFVAKRVTEEQKAQKIRDFRASIDDERAVFFLASSAAGIVDPTVGRVISGLGTAYTQIAEASGMYRLGQISSVMLTADVVSAGLLLASMLGNNGPTGDEIILEQIHQLSLQIDSFRKEMHERFDRVDQTLSRMYVDLIANFNEVNRNIARARQGIVALQVQLINLQGQLGQLDRKVQTYSQGLSSQVASNDQLLCFPNATGSTDYTLNNGQILACELSFTSTGSANAKNAVWNNLSQDYSDDSLEVQLDRPIEENVNFLWGLAASRFDLHPAPSYLVANPVVWAGSSNNYLRLISTSRPISERVGSTDQLISTGNEINGAVKALGQIDLNGTKQTLFDRLIPYYASAMKKTDLDVAALETAYQDQLVAKYNPWKGTEQQKDSSASDSWTYTTAAQGTVYDSVASLAPCADAKDVIAGASLPAPKKLATWIPYAFRMAQELDLGHIGACYSNIHWIGYVQKGDIWNGSLVLEVNVTFAPNPPIAKNKKTTVARTKTAPELLPPPKELLIAHRSATSPNWVLDCQTRKGTGAFGGISVVQCNRDHASGFLPVDTAAALPQLWTDWQNHLVDGASGEMNSSTDVSRDLGIIKTKVAATLGDRRADLRQEVIHAINGRTGNPDFVSEEQAAVIQDFHNIRGLDSLINAYAALLLSHSIETDESVAAGLGSISPDNWIAEISRMGKRETVVPKNVPRESASEVLFPLDVAARTSRAQTLFDKRLIFGAEPYLLLETTLQNLGAVRVVQIAKSLSPTHPCFAGGSNTTIEEGGDASASQTSDYNDNDPLTSIRVSIVPPNDRSSSLNKTDIVIGNGNLLMSGLIDPDDASKMADGKLSITFPANGMLFGSLRNGIVRVCNEFAAYRRDWQAKSIEVDVSKGEGTFETFSLWTNVSFPPGKSSSVTFRHANSIAVPAVAASAPR